MTASNRRRGRDTEQAVAKWLRTHGFPHAERCVKTGWRTATGECPDPSDVVLAPGCIAQVKSLRPVNRMERAVPGWLAETEAQRQAAGAVVALLVVRRDGTADVGEWFAWLPLGRLHDVAWPLSSVKWTPFPDIPVRLLVADAARLLRAAGFGTPLDEEATA